MEIKQNDKKYIRIVYESLSDGGGGKCDDGGGGEHLPFIPGEYTSGTQKDINDERQNMTFESSKISIGRIFIKSQLFPDLSYSSQTYMVFDKQVAYLLVCHYNNRIFSNKKPVVLF